MSKKIPEDKSTIFVSLSCQQLLSNFVSNKSPYFEKLIDILNIEVNKGVFSLGEITRRDVLYFLVNRQCKHQTLTQTQTLITCEFSLPQRLTYVALKR